jgi:hypothetical protein
VVEHTYNPSTQQAEAGVWGQPGLHSKTLFQTTKNNKKYKK